MGFLATLPPYGPKRDAAILTAIAAGGLDPPQWVRLAIGTIALDVGADYLSIGRERIPMSASVAQAAVDVVGAVLPTPRIVEAIENEARSRGRIVPFTPWTRWQDDSQLRASTILWREQQIAAQLGGVPSGTLLAGHLKDVVIAPYMPPARVVLFGGLDSTSRRVQPLLPKPDGKHPGHHADFDGGYAHGVRPIRDVCLVDGCPAKVSEVLVGPRAAELGGPVAAVRYRSAPARVPAAPVQPATGSPPPPSTATSSRRTLLVDVSVHQRPEAVPWKALRAAHVEGVIVRATMGAQGLDEAFTAHLANATAAGVLPIGAYHFFHHDKDPRVQAEHLCRAIGERDLAPVVDVEWMKGEDAAPLPLTVRARVAEAVPVFVREVEHRLGRPVIVYTAPGYASQIRWQEPFGLLWIAAYNRVRSPQLPPWPDWLLWQYKVEPLAGLLLDQNLYRGSLDELRSRLARR
jgi:GH25 family lysozyme M1 (1,4-beta-N-acetylmuramidase)